MRNYLLIILPLVIALSGCGNKDANRIFEENVDFSDGQWARKEQPTFKFNIDDASKNYNFFYNVRINREYKFSNLYIRFYLEDTLGNVLMTKDQQMYLFDPKTGEPNRQSQQEAGGSLGDIYQHKFLCISNTKAFENPGTYQFRIVQSVRDADPLLDVISIGLRIDEVVE